MIETLTKKQKQVLAKKFGGCGCKTHCAKEQFSVEQADDMKPMGRFTVCEIEAEELGLSLKGGKK